MTHTKRRMSISDQQYEDTFKVCEKIIKKFKLRKITKILRRGEGGWGTKSSDIRIRNLISCFLLQEYDHIRYTLFTYTVGSQTFYTVLTTKVPMKISMWINLYFYYSEVPQHVVILFQIY